MAYSSAIIDPYVELDVPRNASQQEIKQAYRRIALASHPDHHSNDATAAERFRRASQSYALLRDPARRLTFDRTGRWDDEQHWEPELDVQLVEALEIFARDFGAAVEVPLTDERAPTHAGRITMPVDISYDHVERGARLRMPAPCVLCAGSGAREGSAQVRCTSCGGSGQLRQVESSLLGPRIHTESCESCHGSGRRAILVCPGCNGSGRAPGAEGVDVVIPRGTADGDALVGVSGNGFRFVARLSEDPRWARDGADLYATKRIPYEVAVLGGAVDVDLPGRKHRVQLAAATASGHRVRIAGEGLPLRDGSGRGDLILTVHVSVPEQVGAVERWLLEARRARSNGAASATTATGIARAHEWARGIASGQWRRWREQHHASSLLRIEKTAASLRSAANLLSESEQSLGPLLERAFAVLAPEAARARTRLDGARVRHAAMGEFVVDGVLAIGLGIGIWFLAWYAASAIAASGDAPWWVMLRHMHPAFYAFVPLAAGLGAGALRAQRGRRLLPRVLMVLLSIAAGVAAAALWLAVHATVTRLAPDADFIGFISVIAAFAASVAPISMFLLANYSIVESARKAVRDSIDRADKRTLQNFDVAAARLATRLEGTERAFRQLLTRADDARHPLTSLFNGNADALANDAQRRLQSTRTRAALALAGATAVTLLWLTAVFVAVVGIVSGGAGAEWVIAGGALAVVALSFRLRESMRAAWIAATIVSFGSLALVLSPSALAAALVRRAQPTRISR